MLFVRSYLSVNTAGPQFDILGPYATTTGTLTKTAAEILTSLFPFSCLYNLFTSI